MLWGSLSVGTSGNTAALATDAKHGSTENIPKYERKFMCEKSGRQSLPLFPSFFHRLSVFQISLDGCAFPKSGGASHTCHAWEAYGPANANGGPHQAVLIVL